MKPPVVGALAAVVLFASLPAQAPPRETLRETLRGRVLARDGSPWSGAHVTLLARPFAHHWDVGEPDLVTVIADGEGRFAAERVTFRDDSAWAWAEDGTGYRVSAVVDRVLAGTELELREREEPQIVVRVQLVTPRVPRAWLPLRWRVVARAPEHAFAPVLEPDADGLARLPALPGTRARLEAITGKGLLVWTAPLALTASRRDAARGAATPGPTTYPSEARELAVPTPPDPIDFGFLVHGADGKPLEHAEVWFCAQDSFGSISDRHAFARLGRSDASGGVHLPILATWSADGTLAWPRPDALILAERHAASFHPALYGLGPREDPPRRDDPVAQVQLVPGYALTGRLIDDDGRPASNRTVILYADLGRQSMTPRWQSTGADGRFRFLGLHPRDGYRLTAIGPVRDGLDREEVALANLRPRGDAIEDPTDDADLGDLALERLASLEFDVTQADGAPAAGVRVLLGETERGGPQLPMFAVADRLGRVRVRALPGLAFGVLASHASGFALSRVEAPANDVARVGLRLTAGAWLVGRVVSRRGSACPRAAHARRNEGRRPAAMVARVPRRLCRFDDRTRLPRDPQQRRRSFPRTLPLRRRDRRGHRVVRRPTAMVLAHARGRASRRARNPRRGRTHDRARRRRPLTR
ncbi:MAG: carboxypeptidase regulatory-like domain-containing protein [Planctomycetes bacterium]|nr:carboxypeptidase regulatory-like domain-containing protein [Planctomycetota bacterium]